MLPMQSPDHAGEGSGRLSSLRQILATVDDHLLDPGVDYYEPSRDPVVRRDRAGNKVVVELHTSRMGVQMACSLVLPGGRREYAVIVLTHDWIKKMYEPAHVRKAILRKAQPGADRFVWVMGPDAEPEQIAFLPR